MDGTACLAGGRCEKGLPSTGRVSRLMCRRACRTKDGTVRLPMDRADHHCTSRGEAMAAAKASATRRQRAPRRAAEIASRGSKRAAAIALMG